ncbi:MAG: 4-hydroxy-2-oxovalerate aldolase [Oscillospiraceae bacterium]
MGRRIQIVDLTLRDGMHAVSHQFTAETMAMLASKIDTVGVDYLEFGHGNGMGGRSIQYGLSPATDYEYIDAVTAAVKNTQLSVVTIPGIGTRFELQYAYDHGIRIARFVTQMSECDIAKQHIQLAKKIGLHPWSLLPHAKCLSVEETVKYAQMVEGYGAEVVYILDGGGSMLPEEVHERVVALKKHLDVPIGLHLHNNLQLAVGNTLAGIDAGAEYVDCCIKGFGAGAGNCPVEPLVAALDMKGYETGVDLYRAMDVGDEYLKPLMQRPMDLASDQVMLGYAGCFSSFLLFARRAAEKYGVDSRDVIKEIGRRGCTEGQEQICIEVAYELAQAKET